MASIAPAQESVLNRFRAHKKNQDKRHDEKDESERQCSIIGALGKLEQIAKTAGRRDKFTDNRPGKSKAHRHLETAEDPCCNRGNIDFAQQDDTPAAKCLHSIDQKLVHVLDAAVNGKKYQDRNENYRESNLGGHLDAKPNYK